MKSLLIAALLVVMSVSLMTAQSVSTLMGAKANGLGYTTSTVFDVWGIYNNIAGVATLENTTASFTYDLHPSLTGASRTAAVAAMPLKTGVTGRQVKG